MRKEKGQGIQQRKQFFLNRRQYEQEQKIRGITWMRIKKLVTDTGDEGAVLV